MTTLPLTATRGIFSRLSEANVAFNRRYPGESNRRQPVHTVYGAADQFTSGIAGRYGKLALAALAEYAPTPEELAQAAGLPEALAPRIHERVTEKLRREPVEDFRADFEDGYGNRPDAEEDGHAEAAAREMAAGLAAGTLPPFIGIRVKPFNEEMRERSLRTIDLFLTTLVRAAGGRLPENLVITLPKVTIPEQSAALADAFDLLEPALGLPAGSLRFEIMIETPQAVLDADGRSPLPHLAAAARGRCVAAHFGTYDYTAACNITAEHQSMLHPVCDFARQMMKVAYAGTGLWISDGSTNVLPVPPHQDAPLTQAQREENRAAVHRAWRLHAAHVRHSLIGGFYQGWDLHPAQLITRYAALYAFFLEGFDAAAERLRNFVQRAAQATSMAGEVVDDAATGQALLNHVLRAVQCGAVRKEEALEKTELVREGLARPFVWGSAEEAECQPPRGVTTPPFRVAEDFG